MMLKIITNKEKVISKCTELFSIHGYAGTSINMIAKHIGLSKASIYHYFATKEDILIACGDSFLKDSKNKTDILKFLNSSGVKSNFLYCMMASIDSSLLLRKHIDELIDRLLFSDKLTSSDISQLIGNNIWDSYNRAVKSKKES